MKLAVKFETRIFRNTRMTYLLHWEKNFITFTKVVQLILKIKEKFGKKIFSANFSQFNWKFFDMTKKKHVTIVFMIFLHSHHMRRYWFYVKNDFRNFHQIFMFWDPLSQKNRFLLKCLSVCSRSCKA